MMSCRNCGRSVTREQTHRPLGTFICETFVLDDGGREAAGYQGRTRDCVARAIAIAAEIPYDVVYATINEAAKSERPRTKKRSSARTGVQIPTTRRFLDELGWEWTPTMFLGSGTLIHLRADELPSGRLVVSVSKHLVAVIDGVIHDVDPDVSRDGTRCVYGYWRKP